MVTFVTIRRSLYLAMVRKLFKPDLLRRQSISADQGIGLFPGGNILLESQVLTALKYIARCWCEVNPERSWSMHVWVLDFVLMSLGIDGLFNFPMTSTGWSFSIYYIIKRSIQSFLAVRYQFPIEEPPTTEWAGELVAPYSSLLLLKSTTKSGKEMECIIQSQKVLLECSIRAVDLKCVKDRQQHIIPNLQNHTYLYLMKYHWSILPVMSCLPKWYVYPWLINICLVRMWLRLILLV